MEKTMLNAFITQRIGNRTDKICRRIFKDEKGVYFVRVNGQFIELSQYHKSKNHTVLVG